MKRFPLALKTLRDQRVAGISAALVAFLIGLMDLLIYPSYKKQLADFQYPDAFKGLIGEAGSIASPTGFITAEYFSWVPLLAIVIAIIAGTAAIAGEEAAGTLDLMLSQPVSRVRLLLEKAAGLTVLTIAISLGGYPAMYIGSRFVEFDLSQWRLFVAVVSTIPIALLFLGLALWCSAAMPSRSMAALTAVGVLVVTYFLNAIGAAVDVLSVPRKLSPFYWSDASHVLIRGFDWLRAGGMLAVALVFLLLALRAFNRRDLSAGGREFSLPWRRHAKG